MLSIKQQMAIIKMFAFWLRREIWTISEFKEIYNSGSAYYLSIKYLENSGIVELRDTINKKKFYSLTGKGINLARILCQMDENSKEIKKLAFYNIEKGLSINKIMREF